MYETTDHLVLQNDELSIHSAAYFSKARHSSKVPVDYTYIKNIKKPPKSPLGFVIFNTHQTMIVEPEKPPMYEE